MKKSYLFVATLLLLVLSLGWWAVAARLGRPFPSASLEITGTPGQQFRGIIRTNGHTSEVSGTVPAQFPLGFGRFSVRTWMTSGPGRMTNVVFKETNALAGADSVRIGEQMYFERSLTGAFGISKSPSNAMATPVWRF